MNIEDVRSKVPKHPTKSPTYRNLNSVRTVVIHHGLTKRGLAGTNYFSYLRYHVVNNNWNVGGYTFGIEDDGRILQGYDLNVRTNHVGNSNSTHLGIVLPGDFRYEDPTSEQYQSLLWLLKVHLPRVMPHSFKIVGHSEVSGYGWKACPVISMDNLRSDVKSYQVGESSTSPSLQLPTQTLSIGDTGYQVTLLQRALNEFNHVITPDGHFGNITKTNLKQFQQKHNLTIDGVAGNQVYSMMRKLYNDKQKQQKVEQEIDSMTKEEILMKLEKWQIEMAHNAIESLGKKTATDGKNKIINDVDEWKKKIEENPQGVKDDLAWLTLVLIDRIT